KLAEKLKVELRHNWTSNRQRQESVAEHVWMMALMAVVFENELNDYKVDIAKLLKIIIIHDLAEAVIGDIPVQEVSDRQKSKAIDEEEAMKKLLSLLPNPKTRQEIMDLWKEFENQLSPEAKLARMIDKTEVLLQHNISDIDLWDEEEYKFALYAKDY